MIRAAFVYTHHGDGWLGGTNYLRNLLGTLAAEPQCGVQPVLLTYDARHPEFEGVEIVFSPALWVRHQLGIRGAWGLLGWDPIDRILRHHRLAVLSHSGPPGPRACSPALPWIPDLQHRTFPEFFQPADAAARDAIIAKSLREAARVILSSEAARRDVERFFPGHAEKLRVLRFVDRTLPAVEATPRELLQPRYGFSGRYLLLPNQYWVHKNHQLVLEALALLQRDGRELLVLSTGSAEDHRNPGHFEGLMRRRAELGIEARFRTLGIVPYPDLAGLVRHAAAVLNPSLFEGWSTTVEEAKSLGKRVLLSDIAVHREQAPERGVYFDPAHAEQLAAAMWAAWTSEDLREEEAAAKRAADALPRRQREFAETYAAIVREVVSPTAPSSAAGCVSTG